MGISIDEIRQSAQKRFPSKYLEGAQSAVCLFGATTNGRTDLIHLYDSGFRNVVVVDGNKAKLDAVTLAFPDGWSYENLQGLEYCGRRLRQEGPADIVIADGSRRTVDSLWENQLPVILAITRKWLIARVSANYLAEYEFTPTPEDISQLCLFLHGVEVKCAELIKRTSGEGGTYWAVIQGVADNTATMGLCETVIEGRADRGPIDLNEVYGGEYTIRVLDMLGQHGCPDSQDCHSVIDSIRKTIFEHERTGVYRFFTSEGFAKLPKVRVNQFRNAVAIFDIAKFSDMDEVWQAARSTTSKKGRVLRDVGRAQRQGYFFKKFNRRMYIPDIYDINTSKLERAGKPMRANYRRSIEELGGYPDRHYEYRPPRCPVHGSTMYGVFTPETNRCIGEIQTNDRLVAYIHFHRSGNLARYSQILGHGNHLSEGIMYFLHFSIVEELLNGAFPGLCYIMYSGYSSRGDDAGLQKWKRRCLFEPKFAIYDEVPDWLKLEGMTYLSRDIEQ